MTLLDAINQSLSVRKNSLLFKLTKELYIPFRSEYDACVSQLVNTEELLAASKLPIHIFSSRSQDFTCNNSNKIYGILVITNLRIFFFAWSKENSSLHEISADDITDVYYDTDPKEAYLRVNGRNIVFVVHDELAVVERLKKAVDELRYAQPEPEAATPVQTNPADNMDQITEAIKNLKSLLDLGAITQEEFDAKKKQLLGLN